MCKKNLDVHTAWNRIDNNNIHKCPHMDSVPSLGLKWRSNIIFDRSIGMTQNSKTGFTVRCLAPISAPSQLSSHESPSQWNSTDRGSAVHSYSHGWALTALLITGLRAHPRPLDMCKPMSNSTEPGSVSLPDWPGTPKRTIQGGRVKGVWAWRVHISSLPFH